MSETNQIRGEDGRFVSQTPQDDAATSPQAMTVMDADAQTQSREKAPAETVTATDPYEVAAKDFGGVIPDKDQSDPVVSDPAQKKPVADDPQTGQQPGREATPPPSPEEKAATAAKDKLAEAVKPYGDMSPNTYALLKSMPGGLVSADEWKAMDSTERLDHVNTVKGFRAAEQRKFQERQQGQQGKQPAPVTPTNQTELRTPHPQGAQGSGVQLPADVQAQIESMKTYLEDPEHPVLKAFIAQSERQARLEAQLSEREQRSQTAEKQAELERSERADEDQVFDSLQEMYPTLSDPRRREDVRREWRASYDLEVYKAQQRGQSPQIDSQSLIRQVVKRELFSETQKAQSERDQKRSAQIRTGSLTRGAPVAPRNDAKPASTDPYAVVASAVNSAHAEGLSGSGAVDRAVNIARGMAPK